MGVSITAGGTVLPSPVELTVSDEIIWSADTGRSEAGTMLGDVVAEKQTWGIRWGVLTGAELGIIRTKLASGFEPVTLTIDGSSVTLTVYRGTLTSELLGTCGGVTYYRTAAVTLIQQ